MDKQFGVSFDETVLRELDKARGDVARSLFLQRLVERFLVGEEKKCAN
jgi:hypothetical protein